MERKVCSKCKEEKEVCEFNKHSVSKDGYKSQCKNCVKQWRIMNKENIYEYLKKWRQSNPEKVKELEKKRRNTEQLSNYQKTYYKNNKNKLNDYYKKWKENNSEKVKETYKKWKENNSEKVKDYLKNWAINNKEKNNEKTKLRKKDNIVYLISCRIRKRTSEYIKKNNISKKNKTFDIVGCSPQSLKEHLEKQFVDGMTWDNYGLYGWHIDHKIPLSSAKTEEELYKLCHYTNLQPLWAEDNLKKSNKII